MTLLQFMRWLKRRIARHSCDDTVTVDAMVENAIYDLKDAGRENKHTTHLLSELLDGMEKPSQQKISTS